jgi:hypothetical protein
MSEPVALRLLISLDQVIPPIKPERGYEVHPAHQGFRVALLTKFWGTPMYLSAVVLVPEGFDEHPEAHFPLMIFHDHFVTDSMIFGRRRRMRI